MKKRNKQTWSNHPHSIAVSRYTLDGEYIDSFDSIGLALDQVSLDSGVVQNRLCTSVKKCCEGKAHRSYGYKWSFKDKPLIPCYRRRNVGGKIWGWNKNTKEVRSWNNVASAAGELVGNRANNTGIKLSLDSPVNRKRSLHREWYFVRNEDDIPKIVPATNDGSIHKTEEMRQLQRELNRYKMVPVVATSVTNPEIVYEYESLRSAAIAIPGDKKAVSNLSVAVKLAATGKKVQRYGYYWEIKEV